MARPPRFNATYYTHDAALRNDRKVKAIRTKFGAAGYGLFHMLLEALTDADHTALDTSGLELELLAGDFGVDASDIEALLKFGEGVGYFARNAAGLLVCAELSKWLEPVFEKRNRSKNPPAAAFLPQAAAETGVSVTETPQSKGKERKEEESKEVNSSLRSEDAAPAAEVEPEKKIEPEAQVENPGASASHTRGAADVGTRKPVELQFPEWATSNFREEWGKWVAYRQKKRDKLKPESLQKLLDKLGAFDEAYCTHLFDNAIANGYTGLVFSDTAQKFAQYLQPQQPGYVYGNQHTAQNGVAGHGFNRPAAVHQNPFGIASPQSLAIARAVVIGSADGNYGLEL